jgi:hypothetical protein
MCQVRDQLARIRSVNVTGVIAHKPRIIYKSEMGLSPSPYTPTCIGRRM